MNFKERQMNRTKDTGDWEYATTRYARTLPAESQRKRAELAEKRARRNGKTTISLKAARAALDALLAR
jgi:hypothetical protein